MISITSLRGLWAYRYFVLGSVKREFQARYQGTQLGVFWVIAHPLSLILVYTLVFAGLMKSAMPGHTSRFAYGIYLCSGILTWNFFTEMLGRCVNIFVENANLLKKVQFPKLCLPIIVTASSALHFCIVMGLFLIFLVVIGSFPGVIIFAMLPVLAIQIALTLGLGILLATINVFFRDVGQSVAVIVQFWFWLTPVVYTPAILPPFAARILEWNPMWPLINAYHDIFLEQRLPAWHTLWYPMLLALVLVALAMRAFSRLQAEIVDEL